MMKILITDDCHPALINNLNSDTVDIDYNPGLTLAEIDEIINHYDGIVINTRVKMDRRRIDLGTRIKFIARMGSGLDIIDLDYAASKNIVVISSPEGNAQAVAEHSLGMLLSLMNKIALGSQQVKDFKWDREGARGIELAGKIFGIVGYGHTGPALAEILSGFRLNVKVFDKYKSVETTQKGTSTITGTTFEDLVESSDIISFNIPLTDETAFLVDEPLISKMKRGVILINASRGKVTNLKSVLKGLQSGQIGGCCLDVFPNEKTDTYDQEEMEIMSALSAHPSVVLTPHVAGWTKESKEKIALILVEKIKKNILSN